MFRQLSVLPVMQLVLIQSSEGLGGRGGGLRFWVVWVFFFSQGAGQGKATQTGGRGEEGVASISKRQNTSRVQKRTREE